mmetsp:Transcript_108240/g.305064  ORF Transcript_108240/g.305064 Transcript_108240/m.305064 type:complete len:250 (-) Transcript_108240:684-1433(-)
MILQKSSSPGRRISGRPPGRRCTISVLTKANVVVSRSCSSMPHLGKPWTSRTMTLLIGWPSRSKMLKQTCCLPPCKTSRTLQTSSIPIGTTSRGQRMWSFAPGELPEQPEDDGSCDCAVGSKSTAEHEGRRVFVDLCTMGKSLSKLFSPCVRPGVALGDTPCRCGCSWTLQACSPASLSKLISLGVRPGAALGDGPCMCGRSWMGGCRKWSTERGGNSWRGASAWKAERTTIEIMTINRIRTTTIATIG